MTVFLNLFNWKKKDRKTDKQRDRQRDRGRDRGQLKESLLSTDRY